MKFWMPYLLENSIFSRPITPPRSFALPLAGFFGPRARSTLDDGVVDSSLSLSSRLMARRKAVARLAPLSIALELHARVLLAEEGGKRKIASRQVLLRKRARLRRSPSPPLPSFCRGTSQLAKTSIDRSIVVDVVEWILYVQNSCT